MLGERMWHATTEAFAKIHYIFREIHVQVIRTTSIKLHVLSIEDIESKQTRGISLFLIGQLVLEARHLVGKLQPPPSTLLLPLQLLLLILPAAGRNGWNHNYIHLVGIIKEKRRLCI